MHATALLSAMTPAEKCIIATIRDHPKGWVNQAHLCDRVTQELAAPSMEAMETLNNRGLIESNPKVGREWGLTPIGREVAELLPMPAGAPVGRERRERGRTRRA